MSTQLPFVSVLTPVYNGEKYLRQCIESVLVQTHQNLEYVIVNNCSTDRTLEIAQQYATRDTRIRLVTNSEFVECTENHNIAFRLMSPRSQYCKLVSADDWIYPDCIAKMVELAELHRSVGIVGAYALRAKGFHSIGLRHDTAVFSGPEVCRLYLLGEIDAFGTPSAVLYRADLVRSQPSFFPGTAPNADLEACLMSLRHSDFGFVQQILSFDRLHSESISTSLEELNSFLLDRIEFLDKYGPTYLTTEECRKRRAELLSEYYDYLAVAVVHLKGKSFWEYHGRRIRKLGYRLVGTKLIMAIGSKVIDLVCNPKHTIQSMSRRVRTRTQSVPTAMERGWAGKK